MLRIKRDHDGMKQWMGFTSLQITKHCIVEALGVSSVAWFRSYLGLGGRMQIVNVNQVDSPPK